MVREPTQDLHLCMIHWQFLNCQDTRGWRQRLENACCSHVLKFVNTVKLLVTSQECALKATENKGNNFTAFTSPLYCTALVKKVRQGEATKYITVFSH